MKGRLPTRGASLSMECTPAKLSTQRHDMNSGPMNDGSKSMEQAVADSKTELMVVGSSVTDETKYSSLERLRYNSGEKNGKDSSCCDANDRECQDPRQEDLSHQFPVHRAQAICHADTEDRPNTSMGS